MEKREGLTPGLEDYLEVIYQIIEEKKAARVKEIAKRLNVNNSSVTGAVKALPAKGKGCGLSTLKNRSALSPSWRPSA